MSIKQELMNLFYSFAKHLPVRNRVLFFSYYGVQYGGSPKYISEYIRKNTSIEMVWSFIDVKNHKDYEGKAVHYNGLKHYYYLATSKIIVTDYRMPMEFKKRRDQIYIHTSHGISFALKKVEKDAESKLSIHYVQMAKKDSEQIDYLLAGSDFFHNIVAQAYWYKGTILDTGNPFSDVHFCDMSYANKKVKSYYEIPESAHIVLYAPTFREKRKVNVLDELVHANLLSALSDRFGGNWYLFVTAHLHHKNNSIHNSMGNKTVLVSGYDDIQEIICAADGIITDYSGIMYDAILSYKPCWLFMPDYSEYIETDRELYFRLDQLPFDCSFDSYTLAKHILDFNMGEYKNRIDDFRNSIGIYDDGHASERVGNLIIKLLNNDG